MKQSLMDWHGRSCTGPSKYLARSIIFVTTGLVQYYYFFLIKTIIFSYILMF